MSENIDIELTADGSHTLFVPELQEHYHSVNGAIQESTHIFINAGLHTCVGDKINILEIGFGTGLNAYLTLLDTIKSKSEIHYTSLEMYPLALDLITKLNYPTLIEDGTDPILYYKLHNADWGKEIQILPNFFLTKIEANFIEFDFQKINSQDLIYFDAFAPEKQPEMWEQVLFDKLFYSLNIGGKLVTYCAKGEVRRMLQRAGFWVERLPGPPGKREMLRATKKETLTSL